MLHSRSENPPLVFWDRVPQIGTDFAPLATSEYLVFLWFYKGFRDLGCQNHNPFEHKSKFSYVFLRVLMLFGVDDNHLFGANIKFS